MLEANKKKVPLKNYSLEIRLDSVNQNLKNKEKKLHKPVTNILTRITDQKILCVYTHVYHILKNQGLCLYKSLCHCDNRKYFLDLSLTPNQREAQSFYLAREVGKISRCSCWESRNFIMINESKYGQAWTTGPSPLSLSLHIGSFQLPMWH